MAYIYIYIYILRPGIEVKGLVDAVIYNKNITP